ncbi:hypothetical protein VPH35_052317 [Triticum aestivum]
MGLWNYGRKGKHDHEAGSSSGRCRSSVKEEPASPPRSSRRAPALAPFTIIPRPAGEPDRRYLCAEVCRRYWETRTSVPWSDVHLPNGWHLSADRVPVPPVPVGGRARHDEIERRRRLLPDNLYYDDRWRRSRREEAMEEDLMAAFHQGLLGQGWGWSCTTPEMAAGVGVNWCATSPRSSEREALPQEEVVQAPPAFQGAHRVPRAAALLLDASGLRRPRQR